MRYVISLKEEPIGFAVELHKLKTSKSNAPSCYKTKRIALKHYNRFASVIDGIETQFKKTGV